LPFSCSGITTFKLAESKRPAADAVNIRYGPNLNHPSNDLFESFPAWVPQSDVLRSIIDRTALAFPDRHVRIMRQRSKVTTLI